MISYIISYVMPYFTYDLIYDVLLVFCSCRVGVNAAALLPVHNALMQMSEGMSGMLTWTMDFDEERDFAEQDSLSDMDIEEDA